MTVRKTGVAPMISAEHVVVIVSQDVGFTKTLTKDLAGYRYRVVTVQETVRASAEIGDVAPSLAIIEGTTAFVAAALKDLRNDPKWKHRPIFTVHAVGTDCLVDCTAVLEKGADASLCTPLTSRQLIARIRAVLRREATVLSHARSYSFGDLQIDLDRHEVTVKGRPVALTLREFQVLEQLAKGPDRVHTRDELLTLVWGANVALEEHNLDVHIHSLRRKLETNPERPRYIVTVRGVGYRLKVS